MDTTRDILFARWHELKGQVQQKWPKLTDDDMAHLSGKTEELAVVLQRRYGYAKVQAEIEIDKWVHGYDQAHLEVLERVNGKL